MSGRRRFSGLLLAIAAGCGGGDGEGNGGGESLVGTWSITQVGCDVGGYDSGSLVIVFGDDGRYFSLFKSGTSCNAGGTYSFDGTEVRMSPFRSGDTMIVDGSVVFSDSNTVTVTLGKGNDEPCSNSVAVRSDAPSFATAEELCAPCVADPSGETDGEGNCDG